MKINTSAWHYKYMVNRLTYNWNWVNSYPSDLCAYIRQFLKMTIVYLVIFCAVTATPFVAYNTVVYGPDLDMWPDYVEMLGIPQWPLVFGILFFLWFATGWMGMIVLALISVLLVLAVIGFGIHEAYRWVKAKTTDPYAPDEPGIIVQAYRGYKNKYCPVIMYEHPDRD